MTQFTVRVELHDADSDDYDALHEQMKKQGFGRTITSSDGTTYRLPPAEYSYSGNSSQSEVLAKAKSAAGAVKTSYEILVTESAGRSWYGLAVLKKAAA